MLGRDVGNGYVGFWKDTEVQKWWIYDVMNSKRYVLRASGYIRGTH